MWDPGFFFVPWVWGGRCPQSAARRFFTSSGNWAAQPLSPAPVWLPACEPSTADYCINFPTFPCGPSFFFLVIFIFLLPTLKIKPKSQSDANSLSPSAARFPRIIASFQLFIIRRCATWIELPISGTLNQFCLIRNRFVCNLTLLVHLGILKTLVPCAR